MAGRRSALGVCAMALGGVQSADGRAMKVRTRSVAEGEHSMQSNFRRYLIAGALTTILVLASAAPANARDLGTASHAWAWLQGVWTQGVSALWAWPGREAAGPGRAAGWVPIIEKEGPGLDPNGLAVPPRPNYAKPELNPNG